MKSRCFLQSPDEVGQPIGDRVAADTWLVPVQESCSSRLGGPVEEVLVKNLSFWCHDPEAAQPSD